MDRTVLLVTPSIREQNALFVFSIGERWHRLVAPNITVALKLMSQQRITVILYDQDLPDQNWRDGVRQLLRNARPVCVILLSFVETENLRREMLQHGGFDVTRKPFHRASLVRLVNGSLRLAHDIDSCNIYSTQQF